MSGDTAVQTLKVNVPYTEIYASPYLEHGTFFNATNIDDC
jgi:hypothetical protein